MKRLGAIVLGISKDSIASHKKFAEKFNLPFVLLSDPKPDVMKKYQAFGKKMMYGRTVEGTIRSTLVIGPNGEVIKHWPTVRNADQHPQEVLAFLRGPSDKD
jgi:peroxiredoxin Q/BCP